MARDREGQRGERRGKEREGETEKGVEAGEGEKRGRVGGDGIEARREGWRQEGSRWERKGDFDQG